MCYFNLHSHDLLVLMTGANCTNLTIFNLDVIDQSQPFPAHLLDSISGHLTVHHSSHPSQSLLGLRNLSGN